MITTRNLVIALIALELLTGLKGYVAEMRHEARKEKCFKAYSIAKYEIIGGKLYCAKNRKLEKP